MNTKHTIKTAGSVLLLLLAGVPAAWAQQAAPADPAAVQPVQLPKILFDPTFYIWLVLGIIVFAVILSLARAVNVLSRMLEEKSGIVRPQGVMKEYARRDTAWSSIMKLMTRSVPVEQEEDVMLHHNYDGIRELDNKLPPWWVWGFFITIMFAVVYLVGYHISGTGKLQLAEYNEQMKQAAMEKEAYMAKSANNVSADNVTLLTDAAVLSEGKNIFEKNCAACHKPDGGGNVGPNLTDQYWIHGGGIKNVFTTITEGVPAKGMISWKAQLSPKQIQTVSSFVLSLQGSNPPGAKEPQGNLWVEQGTAPTDSAGVKTDSTQTVATK